MNTDNYNNGNIEASVYFKPMLEMEKEYNDIKSVLEPLFKTKEIG